MLGDLVSLIMTMTPVLALLVWQTRADRRQRAAWIVRADIDAGEVRLTTPPGYESLIAQASRGILERVPNGYDVIIDCGGGA